MILVIIVFVIALSAIYPMFAPISISVSFDSEKGSTPKVALRLYPFAPIRFGGKTKSWRFSKPQGESNKIIERSSKKLNLFLFLLSDIDLIKTMANEIIRFVIRLVKCPDRYALDLSLQGGFDQPHLTGQIYGAVCAIRPILPESIRVNYDPDYSDDQLKVRLYLVMTIHFAAIVKEFVLFIFRLPVLRIIKAAWRYRKENQYAYQN
jgi:hypothetical protein